MGNTKSETEPKFIIKSIYSPSILHRFNFFYPLWGRVPFYMRIYILFSKFRNHLQFYKRNPFKKLSSHFTLEIPLKNVFIFSEGANFTKEILLNFFFRKKSTLKLCLK